MELGSDSCKKTFSSQEAGYIKGSSKIKACRKPNARQGKKLVNRILARKATCKNLLSESLLQERLQKLKVL